MQRLTSYLVDYAKAKSKTRFWQSHKDQGANTRALIEHYATLAGDSFNRAKQLLREQGITGSRLPSALAIVAEATEQYCTGLWADSEQPARLKVYCEKLKEGFSGV